MDGIARYSYALTAAFCLASFVGGRANGQTPRSEATGSDTASGQALYTTNCSACHQPNGEGVAGTFPPLKGSSVVTKDDATKHIQVVLDGMQGAKAGGVAYSSAMPPFAGTLSNADIATIINYERSSWGNHGKPVTVTQVAAERGQSK